MTLNTQIVAAQDGQGMGGDPVLGGLVAGAMEAPGSRRAARNGHRLPRHAE